MPIYWGATNITNYVDSDTFIDRRKFKTQKELADFIVSMTETEYQKYINASTRYMKSQKYRNFLPENFAKTMISTLNLK